MEEVCGGWDMEPAGGSVFPFYADVSGSLPPEWFAKASLTFIAGDGQANVICSSEPLDPSMDSQTYARIQGDLLFREFPAYTELSYEATDVFGDRPGYVRRFTWVPPDGMAVLQIQVYHAAGGRGYTATGTTPVSMRDRNEGVMDQIIGHLRISPPAVGPEGPPRPPTQYLDFENWRTISNTLPNPGW